MRELTPEEIAAALERVYARPEFVERSTPALLRWLTDISNAVKSWLASVMQSFLQLEATAPFIFWVIVAWLVAALVLAIAHIIYTIGLAFRGRDRAGPRAVPIAESGARIDEADPTVWEARARAAAAAGRLREAALALYHAVILRLDARGTVRFRPGKTPGEYRREARGATDIAPRFDVFLRIFHPLAFGPRVPESAAWDSLRSAAAELGTHA